ncbi:hypothetical protein [Nocardia fluminea]|uniref:hypothetical protein n=1 Tax=Nocardia fluminea TaxID=134984 RepID=UPI0034078B7D
MQCSLNRGTLSVSGTRGVVAKPLAEFGQLLDISGVAAILWFDRGSFLGPGQGRVRPQHVRVAVEADSVGVAPVEGWPETDYRRCVAFALIQRRRSVVRRLLERLQRRMRDVANSGFINEVFVRSAGAVGGTGVRVLYEAGSTPQGPGALCAGALILRLMD